MRQLRHVKLRSLGSLGVLLSFVIGGCRTSTEPEAALRGTFVLRTVNDVPLPVDRSTQSSYHLFLIADTLRFDGKGAATRRWAMQEQFASQPVTLLNYAIDYRYSISDGTVYLQIVCPATADCFGNPTGQAVGRDSLLIESGGDKYLFVRVKATWPPHI